MLAFIVFLLLGGLIIGALARLLVPGRDPMGIGGTILLEMLADRYRTYRRLRDSAPVHYSAVVRAWVLTRYTDVVTMIADPRFSSDRTKARKYKGGPRSSPGTFLTDPPQHTRIRALV